MQTYADFPVGATFTTGGVTITEAHLVGFAGLTGDFFAIHTDEEFAKTTEFGTRIIHGPLVYSMALGQIYQARIFVDLALALLGVDNMRHLAPCFVGTTITTNAEIVESRAISRPGHGVVKAKLRVADQNATTVMECEIAMLARAPEAQVG